MKRKYGLLIGAVAGLAAAQIALADETALNLIKKGNDYVGMPSRDKVLEIYSDKSIGSLSPNVWYVVYYDPTVAFKAVEVKFGAGQEMEVSHSIQPFRLPARERDVMDSAQMSVDSDRALAIAQSQPLLKNLTLRSSRMTLERGDSGPAWRIQLFAAGVNDPSKEADIGTVVLSATDGSVIKADLNPARAD